MLDIVVAGGTDALSKFTLNGFNSLMILDRSPCRPFDANRNGLNLGEGAGFLVLVSDQVKNTEHLHPYTYVNGFSNTNDAYHQTASSPDGRGSFGAMQKALTMSGLHPEEGRQADAEGRRRVGHRTVDERERGPETRSARRNRYLPRTLR